MIKVAIMGYGTVGSGVYEVFRTNKTSIDKKVGQELRVQYVLDLREFPGDPVMDVLTHDFEDILNDDEVKIVAEVMGGLHPAYEFTRRCLEAGKSVCTSNKELVAEHGAELIQIAKNHQVNYLFEACLLYTSLAVFRRRKIGFVFQTFNLISSVNVWENIVLPLGLDGRKVDEAYVNDIIATLGKMCIRDRLSPHPTIFCSKIHLLLTKSAPPSLTVPPVS